jgi:hypothetical protein
MQRCIADFRTGIMSLGGLYNNLDFLRLHLQEANADATALADLLELINELEVINACCIEGLTSLSLESDRVEALVVRIEGLIARI